MPYNTPYLFNISVGVLITLILWWLLFRPIHCEGMDGPEEKHVIMLPNSQLRTTPRILFSESFDTMMADMEENIANANLYEDHRHRLFEETANLKHSIKKRKFLNQNEERRASLEIRMHALYVNMAVQKDSHSKAVYPPQRALFVESYVLLNESLQKKKEEILMSGDGYDQYQKNFENEVQKAGRAYDSLMVLTDNRIEGKIDMKEYFALFDMRPNMIIMDKTNNDNDTKVELVQPVEIVEKEEKNIG